MFQAKNNVLRADQKLWGVGPRSVKELPVLGNSFREQLLLFTRSRAVLPKTAGASLSGTPLVISRLRDPMARVAM